MTTEARFRRDIEALAGAIGAAREAVAAGMEIDLGPLQTRAEALCAASAEVAPGGEAAVRPLLIGLIDEFDRLAEALRARQDEIAGALGGSRNRRRAHTAYHRAPSGKR